MISTLERIASSLEGGALSGRLLTNTTLGFADSLALLNLTAAGLIALAVGLPEALVVADLGNVVGGVALRLSWSALDFLVAVCVASRTDVAGTDLEASLNDLPALGAADHDRTICAVALVSTELAVYLRCGDS